MIGEKLIRLACIVVCYKKKETKGEKYMNILIIEDNFGIAQLICDKLSECGYNTHMVHTGKDTLEYYAQNKPDLMVLDYSLPDMDGKEIITSLRNMKGELPPFIVSTGRGDERVAVDMMKLGAYDYLIKDPYLINRLPDVIAKVISDINTRNRLKEAEQALLESEERFRSFVENSSDMFVKVSEEGIFTYVSPNSHQLLGFDATEMLGKHFEDFIYNDDTPAVFDEFFRLIKQESTPGVFEYRIRRKDGDMRYHSVKGFSVKENNNIYINCIVSDITEKRRAENRLLNAIVQTEESERRKFAEELHEGIGPLLSALKLYMEKIKAIKVLTSKESSSIEFCDKIVDDSVKQVRRIANNLMPSVLNDFGLAKAMRSFIGKVPDDKDVKINFTSSEDFRDVDPLTSVILYRGLIELLNNSLKHSNASQIDIDLSLQDNLIVLEYADNGSGFSFTDYLTTANKGMGLMILKSRVNSLSGKMDISSQKEEGVLVKITVNMDNEKEKEFL